MKQFINNKSLRRMDLFVLRKQKKPLQPEPWCCTSSSQGPARVFLYFDKLTHFQMKQERMVISPHKLLQGSPNSSSIYPYESSAFNLPSLWPNASIYNAVEEVIQLHHQWDNPLFGWDSSLIDGISSSLVGVHEPSGGASNSSNRPLECSRSNHK